MFAGLIGVALGAETARRYKQKNPRADPLICAFGMLSCVPFLFLALFTAQYNTTATWVSFSKQFNNSYKFGNFTGSDSLALATMFFHAVGKVLMS